MINYKEFVKQLFGLYKKHYKFIIGLIIFLMIVMFTEIMLIDMSIGTSGYIGVSALIFFINTVIQLGMFKIALHIVNNNKFDFSTLFITGGYIFNFIITSLIYYIGVIVGIFLLIVPGIMFSVLFMFYPFIMIEKGTMPIDSLKISYKLVKNNLWQIFVICIVLYFINYLGAMAFYIGVTITLPFTLIAQALLYKKILIRSNNERRKDNT